MARIVAIVDELMFSSRIEATLAAAGHEVTVAPAVEAASLGDVDLIVADLADVDPAAIAGKGTPVLGFYSHVDVETRRRAEAAGVDLAVPRSRLVREMPELVERLAS